MRFRFCWDCDCPEWLLAQMAPISKMKSDALSSLAHLVAESISSDEKLEYENALEFVSQFKMDENTTRALIAALRWILESATGSETEPKVLSSELQQLGLPREHSLAIEKIYQDFHELIKSKLKEKTMKASSNVKWDFSLKGFELPSSTEAVAQATISGNVVDLQTQLASSNEAESSEQGSQFIMTKDQVDTLLQDLKEAQKRMEELK